MLSAGRVLWPTVLGTTEGRRVPADGFVHDRQIGDRDQHKNSKSIFHDNSSPNRKFRLVPVLNARYIPASVQEPAPALVPASRCTCREPFSALLRCPFQPVQTSAPALTELTDLISTKMTPKTF